MLREFKLPDIGEGIAEGEVVKWHVSEGDPISEDDLLVEVMTDKVTVEITSPFTGYVNSLNASEGDVINVGEVIATFSDNQPSGEKEHAPDINPTVLASRMETEDANQSQSDKLNQLFYDQSCTNPRQTSSTKVLATPATRKLARELGIDLAMIYGTGPKGRILPEDVQNYKQQERKEFTTPKTVIETPTVCRTTSPTLNTNRELSEERIPYRGIRRKIGEHLVKSKHTAPHYAYVEEVDMTEVVAIRNKLYAKLEYEYGIKLNYLPFIMKAVVEAMKIFPEINATLDEKAHEIVYKKYYNFGIAVSTDRGLIVPVLKNVDKKSIKMLAGEIYDLSIAAREDTLSIDQVTDGTFSITSIGSIGGFVSIPIINYPEVAILGVNKISKRPVVRDNEIVIRQMMNLSLSLDHRVIDGVGAAGFSKQVVEYLENPYGLMVDL